MRKYQVIWIDQAGKQNKTEHDANSMLDLAKALPNAMPEFKSLVAVFELVQMYPNILNNL